MWITSEANTCNSLPALLWEENLPLLWKCFSGVSRLREAGTSQNTPFPPLCFCTDSFWNPVTSARSLLIEDESYIPIETHHQVFKQAPGWEYFKAVRMSAWSLRKGACLPALSPPAGGPQPSHRTWLSLTFSICTMEVIKIVISKGLTNRTR